MLQVLIVGDRESGKTTFLTLLYAASVKSGSDKADEFRFHAPIESMETASILFQQLMAGALPHAVTKKGNDALTPHLGSRPPGGGGRDGASPGRGRGRGTAMGDGKTPLASHVLTMSGDSTNLAAKVEGPGP